MRPSTIKINGQVYKLADSSKTKPKTVQVDHKVKEIDDPLTVSYLKTLLNKAVSDFDGELVYSNSDFYASFSAPKGEVILAPAKTEEGTKLKLWFISAPQDAKDKGKYSELATIPLTKETTYSSIKELIKKAVIRGKRF